MFCYFPIQTANGKPSIVNAYGGFKPVTYGINNINGITSVRRLLHK